MLRLRPPRWRLPAIWIAVTLVGWVLFIACLRCLYGGPLPGGGPHFLWR